jgi:hypothetical protein
MAAGGRQTYFFSKKLRNNILGKVAKNGDD